VPGLNEPSSFIVNDENACASSSELLPRSSRSNSNNRHVGRMLDLVDMTQVAFGNLASQQLIGIRCAD
jgi:hypothetical protein